MLPKLYIIIIFFILLLEEPGQTIDVNVTGIRNRNGNIILNIYDNAESFIREVPEYSQTTSKLKVKDSTLQITIENLPHGTYGIALIDDENKNGKLDRKFLVPKEGFGFSNYKFTGRKKPKFEYFSFPLQKEENKKVTIEVLYY